MFLVLIQGTWPFYGSSWRDMGWSDSVFLVHTQGFLPYLWVISLKSEVRVGFHVRVAFLSLVLVSFLQNEGVGFRRCAIL